MNWKNLETEVQLNEIVAASQTKPQAIFKHSTRCYISKAVLKNLEHDWNISTVNADIYYLDLLAHRDISNAIASRFAVEHQSPQLIVLFRGDVMYSESHQSIDVSDVKGSIGFAAA